MLVGFQFHGPEEEDQPAKAPPSREGKALSKYLPTA